MRNIDLGFSWVFHSPILDFLFLCSGNGSFNLRAAKFRWAFVADADIMNSYVQYKLH